MKRFCRMPAFILSTTLGEPTTEHPRNIALLAVTLLGHAAIDGIADDANSPMGRKLWHSRYIDHVVVRWLLPRRI